MFFVALLLFTLIACALIVVVVQNLATQLALVVFAWQLPSLPVGLLLLGAFILGAILLYIVSALSALRDQRERRLLQKRIQVLEQQLQERTLQTPQAMPIMQPVPPPMPVQDVPRAS